MVGVGAVPEGYKGSSFLPEMFNVFNISLFLPFLFTEFMGWL
jgi:hypothetical protein